MNPHYITLVDDEGRLAAILPFEPEDTSYDALVGRPLGCTALTEEDKNELMLAYAQALVDKERKHCSYHWKQDGSKTMVEIEIVRFPPVTATAILLSEVVPVHDRPALSKRELEVVRLAAADQTDEEIARKLKIAKGTVARHKQNIREKLGLKEWASAVLWAHRQGLLSGTP